MSVFGVSPRSIVESILVHQTFLVDPSAKRNKLDKGVLMLGRKAVVKDELHLPDFFSG